MYYLFVMTVPSLVEGSFERIEREVGETHDFTRQIHTQLIVKTALYGACETRPVDVEHCNKVVTLSA